MDARQERGLAIAQTQTLVQKESGAWVVPSQSGNGKYTVFADKTNPRCSCPDHVDGQYKCKHIFAVEFKLSRTTQEVSNNGTIKTTTETLTVKTTAERKTYPQKWPEYNAGQCNERGHFHALLAELCSTLPETPRKPGRGRKPVDYKDGLFAAVLKVFSEKSARRFNGELEDACQQRHISKVPHFTSVLNIFDKEETTPLLKSMIETSSLPLRAVESKFATDSTGFATATYNQWLSEKHGVPKRYSKFIKAHFTTGCLTNVVTSVVIDSQNANDIRFLPELTKRTSEIGFRIKEMSADSAYGCNANFDAVESVGGKFYPVFKANTTGACGGSFEKAFHYFSLHKEEYVAHYHVRSNVESTVSMVKRKFGDAVKAKNELAQKNEVYAKFVCHNLCVLIQEMYVQGIDPTMGKRAIQPTMGKRAIQPTDGLKIFNAS